jgi:hypothetical protein
MLRNPGRRPTMRRLLCLLLLGVPFATGCVHEGYGYHRHGGAAAVEGVVAMAELTQLAVSAASADDEDVEPPPPPLEPVPTYGYFYVVPPSQPPRVSAPEPVHRAFDATAALTALHGVDVRDCAEDGAPNVYGHARVVFRADGRAQSVTIDQPTGLSKDVVDCVGRDLGEVSVPPFDGAAVGVGTSFFLGDAPPSE